MGPTIPPTLPPSPPPTKTPTPSPTTSPTPRPTIPPTPPPSALPTKTPTQSPTQTPTPAPTTCEDLFEPETKLNLKLYNLTCTEIAQDDLGGFTGDQTRCGSPVYKDNGIIMGKAKFICRKSCGECTPPPPTECEDLVEPATKLNLKFYNLNCTEIARDDFIDGFTGDQTRCGSPVYNDNGISVGKAKTICRKSCGECLPSPTP